MIDEMTLPQVEELGRYWREHPPVHLLLAAFIGVRPERQFTPPVADEPQSAIRALASIPGMEPSVNDDMPSPIFDPTELFMMRP